MSIERRIVTILFADLVDFTPLSERLDAEDVATLQDAYFGVVRETVGRYGGSLEKFIGDAVMAAFGLGTARDDDAERAVRAGLALIHGVDSLGARLGLDVAELRVRVGVNTGEAVIGAAIPAEGQGTGLGRVTGENVNVAARLQAASAPGRVLVGEATALAIEASVELEPIRPVALKGVARPVNARYVVAIRPEPSRAAAMGGMVAPTIGRRLELDSLLAADARTRAGARQRVAIIAPPGVGKSRLMDAFLAVASDGSTWWTRSRQERGGPLELVRDVLVAALGGAGVAQDELTAGADAAQRQLETLITRTGESADRARVVADAVRDVVAAPDAAGATHEAASATREAPGASAARSAVFDAWSLALRAAAGGRPARWVIEDLHWAGADEIAFVESLTDDPGWRTLLIVATARPSLTTRLVDGWDVVQLGTLPALSARELVSALVGDALPSDLVDRIVDASDGNPLFIEELLRTWVSVGTLVRDGMSGPWTLAAPASEIPLPTTIQAIYASQLDDLPGDARSVARRASVAGRRFPIEALREIDPGDPERTVAELARRAIVSGPVGDDLVGDSYLYRHALVRDAGYASLARAERADLHVRLARWLELAAGDKADRLAAAIGGHYADALASGSALAAVGPGGLARDALATLAATWLERAGEHALSLAAYDAARAAFRQAIDLTMPEAGMDLGRRLTRLGDSLAGTGGLDEAIAAYSNAIGVLSDLVTSLPVEEAEASHARRALARAARSLGLARYEQTRFAEAIDVATAAAALFPTGDELARLPVELVGLQARLGLTNDAALVTEAADLRQRAETLGDPDVLLEAVRTDVLVRSEAGQASAAEWLDLGRRQEDRRAWTPAAASYRNAAAMTVDPLEFEELAGRVDALADAHGLTEIRAWMAHGRAHRQFADGAWDGALRNGLVALDIGETYGYHRVVVRTWFILSPLAAARRDRPLLERAAAWFDARDRDGTFPDSPYGRLMHAAVAADFASAGVRDGTVPASSWLETAFGLPFGNADWLVAVERVVEAMIAAGRSDDAVHATRLAAPSLAGETSPLAWASAALLTAWSEQAAGRPQEAVTAARDGLARLEAEPAPWWELRLLMVLERVGAASADERTRQGELARRLGVPAEGSG